MNRIYNEDMLHTIKRCKKNNIKIDLCITDPPYNISRKNNFKTIGRNGIDFGEWDYNFDQLSWIKEVDSIMNKNSSIIIFNNWRNLGDISIFLEKLKYTIKDIIKWTKTNPMPRNINSRYVPDYEYAVWATKGKKWTFNKDKEKKYLRSEFSSSIPLGKNRIHPTQKSIELFEELIKIHSNENDVVFDPFMGSGTTALACFNTRRNFIGSEINTKFFNDSQKRLTKFRKITRSPLYYIGDKYEIIKKYYSTLFPDNISVLYDVFGGGGSVSTNVIANKIIYNDFLSEITDLLNYFKNKSASKIIDEINFIIKSKNFVNKANSPEINKKKYLEIRKNFNNKKYLVSRETDFLFLIIFGFNSNIRFNSKNKFNIPIGKGNFNSNRKELIRDFCRNLKNVTIENHDYYDFVMKYAKYMNKDKNSFFYFDPPYLISTAPYNSFWSEEKEIKLYKLLNYLNEKKYKWSISNILEKGNLKNTILLKWINENKKKYTTFYLDKNYLKSNYQRKKVDSVEICVRNW